MACWTLKCRRDNADGGGGMQGAMKLSPSDFGGGVPFAGLTLPRSLADAGERQKRNYSSLSLKDTAFTLPPD